MKASLALLLLCISAAAHAAVTENVASARDAAQTYTLVLPNGYSTDRKWPALILMDPRGRGTAAAEIFREAAEEMGWLVISSNNTSSDTGWEPNVRAMDALSRELAKYAVDPQRVYAAGFSGTATVAWVLVKTQRFAGVINAGQPFQPDLLDAPTFAVWGAAGVHDFNYAHVRRIDGEVEKAKQPHRFEVFDGAHQWMPAALARAALEWHDVQAMRSGRQTRDAQVINRASASDLARASTAADELAALRHYDAIQRDFEGLRDTSEAARAAAALRDTPRVRTLQRDERNADAYEKRELEGVIARLRETVAAQVPPSTAARTMRVAAIQRDAAEKSYRGAAAQRVIETLFSQTSFFLPQRYFAAKEYDKAAIVLAIAGELKPDRAHVQYDLARALARSGRGADALNALEKAMKLGLRQANPRNEADFESLRSNPRFAAITGS